MNRSVWGLKTKWKGWKAHSISIVGCVYLNKQLFDDSLHSRPLLKSVLVKSIWKEGWVFWMILTSTTFTIPAELISHVRRCFKIQPLRKSSVYVVFVSKIRLFWNRTTNFRSELRTSYSQHAARCKHFILTIR